MLPVWVAPWCAEQLGAAPIEVLHESAHMSEVYGLRLADGRSVAVKSRPAQNGREPACVEVQRFLAAEGFPAVAPLTGVTVHAGQAIHAEEWRPGGDLLRSDDAATARLFAALLARQVDLTAALAVPPPLPNPEWTRWNHSDPGPFPALPYHDESRAGRVPGFVTDAARRVRERLAASARPRVLGHADWESQNLRWHGDRPWAVHDWDSLAWLPEAAIAGAACGAFASSGRPTLAPVRSSAAFLAEYQRVRRPFDDDELEVAWAASLWLGLHNARGEALDGRPPVALAAVEAQSRDRLRLAGAA